MTVRLYRIISLNNEKERKRKKDRQTGKQREEEEKQREKSISSHSRLSHNAQRQQQEATSIIEIDLIFSCCLNCILSFRHSSILFIERRKHIEDYWTTMFYRILWTFTILIQATFSQDINGKIILSSEKSPISLLSH